MGCGCSSHTKNFYSRDVPQREFRRRKRSFSMANTICTVATDPSPQSSRYREIVADKVFLYYGSNVETPTMLYIHISNLRPPKTPTQTPRSRPISILLRHTNNPIRRRKRIKLLPFLLSFFTHRSFLPNSRHVGVSTAPFRKRI